MDRGSRYYQQVQLLMQLLGFVDSEPCFALKGGTAINLFVRDFPRLSVDIDLVYLPLQPRNEALPAIMEALNRIADAVSRQWQNVRVVRAFQDNEDALRLLVSRNGVQVKIELSPVLRGVVFEVERRQVNAAVETEFGFAEVAVVSLADLYAGKICAALDRQHPRDLFDVKMLLDNEGITDAIRRALIVYLISHNRPLHELLDPHQKPLAELFSAEFQGMVFVDVSLDELEAARTNMFRSVLEGMSDSDRAFLLSFHNKQPDWSLLNLDGVSELPAVQWKLLNLEKMRAAKHQSDLVALTRILGGYQLVESLPAELQTSLPSIEQIEQIERELAGGNDVAGDE